MLHGLKRHNINGNKVESSTVHISNIKKHWTQINEIVALLQEYLLNQNLDYFIFIIHDMEAFESWMYQIDKNGFTRKKYDEYTARGSTIIPELQEKLPQKQYKKTS